MLNKIFGTPDEVSISPDKVSVIPDQVSGTSENFPRIQD